MHDVTIIEIDGKKREVDKELVPLILELNHLGLKTLNSCQGTCNNYAYLSIQMDEKSRFDYYAKKGVLTIRWDRTGKEHLPVESQIITNTGVIRISEVVNHPRLEIGGMSREERGKQVDKEA